MPEAASDWDTVYVTTCHEADAFHRTYRMVLLGVLLTQGWEDRNPGGSRASASYEGACPQGTQAQAMLGSNALSVTCSLL